MLLKKYGTTKMPIQTNMLYYSHTNEDNRIEQQLLQSSACTTAIVVAGSGERVLALMGNSYCKKIIAVDINEEAIFLLQLKMAAITYLTNEEYFQFTGHYPALPGRRLKIFEKIKPQLSITCAVYWEQNRAVVEKGILYAGHFEKFIARVRPVLNLFLGGKFQGVFDQDSFNARLFPESRWKLLSWMFSQKWVYKLWGNKDKAFIGSGASAERIPTALNSVIKKGNAPSCFMAHLIFKGHLRFMAPKDLPPAMQNEFLNIIRKRILNREIIIDYYREDLLHFMKESRVQITTPVFLSASDILSFEDRKYLAELIKTALQNAGDMIVWRGFLRNILTKQELKTIAENHGNIERHDEQESTEMYQVFSITNATA